MKNKDNFKKAMDNIHASDDLKNRTFQKIKDKPKNNVIYMKVLSACAVFAIIFGIGTYYNGNPNIIGGLANNKSKTVEDLDLPRFENIDELKKVLAKSSSGYGYNRGLVYEDAMFESVDSSVNSGGFNQSFKVTDNAGAASSNSNYSTTNVQVEGVDEADIVKTDGEYIYLVKSNTIYIVKASDLKIENKLILDEDDDDFMPEEIFVNKDKLVVLGTNYIYDEDEYDEDDDYNYSYYRYNNSKTVTEAVVVDISNKNKPKEERRVSLDGEYVNARMIGDNVYFISNKYIYYYKDSDDDDILPVYKDSVNSKDIVTIPAEDIIYFGGTRNYTYMLVGGFNVNDEKEASVETIFGASDTVYANSENLYIVQEKYTASGNTKSVIYKFGLNDSKITLKAKGSVKGYLNNQFSMDEYEGNLRVATTSNVTGVSKNQVYVLDENLEKIGALRNMAIDEEIYSVRFIGKIGYVVTYKQIDPLFVIDLSDPTNPEIKGELKIPGYSSYLHPYDETHIIGIGYNTETNKWGGTVNKSMKMSMFDVSDLENPKEIFNIDIGDEYAYSEITSNHKALFYNKDKNLIGFPVTYRTSNYVNSKSGFVIYKIDLNKGFEVFGEITDKTDYNNQPERVIYIGDNLYTIYENEIDSYDLDTLKKKDEVVFNK